MMSSSKGASVCIGIGAMLGLGVGAATGYGVSRALKKQHTQVKTPLPELTDEDASNIDFSATQSPAEPEKVAEADAPKPGKEGTHDLFGTTTHYLTRNSEFFAPLDRFYQMLQFKEEKDAFVSVVTSLDNLLGMEILLNARTPVAAAAIPSLAQRTRNKIKAGLRIIVQFSDEKRPSPTKKGAMQSIVDDMLKTIDEIIKGLHRTIAAAPMTSRT